MAAAAAQRSVSAQVVGNALVQQYYHIQHQSPGLVHRFYQDSSKLGRPDSDGAMSTTTTMQAINEKILSLNYGEFRAEIKSVDAQESYNGGVHVLVIGSLSGKDNMIQNFTQTFFLAPQEKGYFVLNDIFRYVEDIKHANGIQTSGTDIEAPLTQEQDPSPGEENHVSEQTVMVMKESAMPLSSPAPVPRRSPVNSQAQQVNNTQASAPVAETPVSGSDAADNGNNQEGEADGYAIYIKGLPMNATASLLEDEFKKFGTIKAGGVQVRSNKKKGFYFGFVEFEVESAVQKAIEASPVSVGGCQAYVEEKRSTNSRACDMADDSAIVRTDAGLESRKLHVYAGDSCQHSSPPTSLEGGGGGPYYELYDQLEKAMAEEDKSLREAFEESMRRREALKDAMDAVRMRERKDFEEALARKAKEVENMSQQVDKIAIDLCIALDESRHTPPYFICPIRQDIMRDPHVAADGYTYELEALTEWLHRGHSTSPMTNLQLPHCNAVQNHSLRSAIQEWQQLQRQ